MRLSKGRPRLELAWGSSVQDVIKAYGKPIHDYSGQDGSLPWRRVAFKGIDFRFENDKMVRIAIRADEEKPWVVRATRP